MKTNGRLCSRASEFDNLRLQKTESAGRSFDANIIRADALYRPDVITPGYEQQGGRMKDESDLKLRISNLRFALSLLILPLCSWMVLVVGGAQVTICDVRINLRGRDVGVSQQSLDGA